MKRDRSNDLRGVHLAERSLFAWLHEHREQASKAGFYACLAFLGLTIAYGIAAGGHWDRIHSNAVIAVNETVAATGFAIETVQVDGQHYIPSAEIIEALGPYEGLSIFAFDTGLARRRLKQNGWIRDARVTRLLPSTLVVELEERAPFALWREGGSMAVVDDKGQVLALGTHEKFPELPIVSGRGAAVPARQIVQALAAVPEIKARVQEIRRVAGRRWDLLLDTGLKVKLPSRDVTVALAELSRIAAKNPVAFYEISEVDFRIPSQLIVRLKDESENGRKKFLSWLSPSEDSLSQGL